jgi:hypothetical protein
MPLFSFEGLAPQVHAGAFVAPTATLVGDVIVEEGASIWYGAVIRADYAPVIIRKRTSGQCVIPDRPVDHHRAGATVGPGYVVHGAILDGVPVRTAASCSTSDHRVGRSSRPGRWSPQAHGRCRNAGHSAPAIETTRQRAPAPSSG